MEPREACYILQTIVQQNVYKYCMFMNHNNILDKMQNKLVGFITWQRTLLYFENQVKAFTTKIIHIYLL